MTLSFIFFRANDFTSGLNFINNFFMNIGNIFSLHETEIFNFQNNLIFVFLFLSSLIIVNFFPNSQEITFSLAPRMNIYNKEISSYKLSIRSTYKKSAIALLLIFVLYLNLSQLVNINEYIYFRF